MIPRGVIPSGPASNSWRSSLSQRGRTPSPSGVTVTNSSIKDLGLVAAAAVNTTYEWIAAAGAASVHLIEAKTKVESGTKISTESPDSRVRCMDWVNHMLVTGSGESTITLYRTSRSSAPKQIACWHAPSPQCDNAVFLPGSFFESSNISSLAVCPASPGTLCTILNNTVHLWDSEWQSGTPLLSINASESPLYCCCWDPFSAKNCIMLGGADATLRMLDSRTATDNRPCNMTWIRKEAHKHSITSLAWSPFIPYWVASGGDDGIINLWDLRYGARSALSLKRHYNTIRTISWSKRHAELLVSGSVDRGLNLWSLCVPPHRCLYTFPSNHGIIQTGFSPTELCSTISVSGLGDFSIHTFDDSFLTELVNSRFPESDTAERDVEKLVYMRKFSEAFPLAYETAGHWAKENDPDKALAVLELCQPKPSIDVSQLQLSLEAFPSPDMVQQAAGIYSYFIPPGYNERFEPSLDKQLMEDITQLRITLELQSALFNGRYEEILNRHKEVCKSLAKDKNFVSPGLLKRVVRFSMAQNYTQTLGSLAPEYASIYAEAANFAAFVPIAHLLLYPTIFEELEDPQSEGQTKGYGASKTHLQQLLEQHSVVIEQLRFTSKFYEALWSSEPDKAKALTTFVIKKKPKEGILSLPVSRIFLNTLAQMGRYDKFYVELFQLVRATEGFPAQEMFKTCGETAAALFNRSMDAIMSPDLTANTTWETSHLQKSIISVISMSCVPKGTCKVDSERFPDILEYTLVWLISDFLSRLCSNFERSLAELINNPDPTTGSSGKAQAKAKADELISDLEELKSASAIKAHIEKIQKKIKTKYL